MRVSGEVDGEKGVPPPLPEESLRATKKVRIRANGADNEGEDQETVADIAMDEQVEDYARVLTGGPWVIFGAYLVVQPWTIDFDHRSANISSVVAWIRVPGLSFRYYHKSTLRAIGNLLGEVVKIDYRTETRGRGRYARIAVIVDLLQPLIPWIKVDGKTYGVEYEGLPVICFGCGKYGHSKERCPARNPQREGAQDGLQKGSPASQQVGSGDNPAVGSTPEQERKPYGDWMQEVEAVTTHSVNENGGTSTARTLRGDQVGPTVVQKRRPSGESDPLGNKSNHQGRPKQKGGKVGPVMEYRMKSPPKGPGAQPPPQPGVGLLPPGNGLEGTGVKSGERSSPIEDEQDSTLPGGDCPMSPITANKEFATVIMSSTLDSSKHTVVKVQRQESVLTEVDPSCRYTSNSELLELAGDDAHCMGKENMAMVQEIRKSSNKGIKLQAYTGRNLKVRRKPTNSHISKDARLMLRGDLEMARELAVIPTSMPEPILLETQRENDPPGADM
ncbi:hypothetical protein K1719_044928 [Acacia pycnantha]|nr:hypothetical protein K1719_044928 [Acacia pycnantha]